MFNIVLIGQFGLNPEQLQAAGIIKPGSAKLVQSLVDKGAPLANALPKNLFTGSQGAKTVNDLKNNFNAQSSAMTNVFQKGQAQLMNAKLITGKESSTAIAGLINAAATVGVPSTLAAVKGAVGRGRGGRIGRPERPASRPAGAVNSNMFSVALQAQSQPAEVSALMLSVPKVTVPSAAGGLSALKGAVGGAASNLTAGASAALNKIGSGNLAGKMADEVTSGLGPLKDSLAGLADSKGLASIQDQAKGLAASAFDAIKSGFPKLPAGVPVDIEKEAKDAFAKVSAAAAGGGTGDLINKMNDLTKPGSALQGALSKAGGELQNKLSGGAAALGKNLPGAVGDLKAKASDLGSLVKGQAAGIQSTATNALNRTIGAASITGIGSGGGGALV